MTLSTPNTQITCPILPSGDNEETQITTFPKSPTQRKCTNTTYLIAFATCFGVVMLLSIVLSWGGDFNRFLHGHDRYGNICGIKNNPIRGINCSGHDMTHKPLAQLRYIPTNKCFPNGEQKFLPHKCVDSCYEPLYESIFHRCYPPENVNIDKESVYVKQLHEILHAFYQYSSTIIVMTLTGFVLSFGIYFCIKCSAAATFWSLIVFQLIVSVVATSYFTHKYVTNDDKSILFLFLAVSAIAYFLFILIFLFFFRENLTSMFWLYQETISAIFRMPLILIQPFLTLLVVIILTLLIVMYIILIMSNGCFKRSTYDPFTYEQTTNIVKLVYVCFLIFMLLWIIAFAQGWQCMVISGAVGQYYFTRNKFSLQQPLKQSFYVLIRYHLGTIACGSLITTLFSFMGSITEFFIRKAYIQTALHGEELFNSSLRSLRLLCNNMTHTVVLTAFNYFVAHGFMLLVVLLTVVVGIWMNLDNSAIYYISLSIFFGAISAATVAYFVIQVLYIASDAMFLYLCEEQIKSDGDNKNSYKNLELSKMMQEPKDLNVAASNH